jgi:glycosyltransferase involved in cell wall biosynthesis
MEDDANTDTPLAVFIADRIEPRLGMERALHDLLRTLQDPTELILICGPTPSAHEIGVATSLGMRPGWLGRLRAIPQIRQRLISADPSSRIVVVGIWAYVPSAIASIGTKQRLVLWEHSLLPWRRRHELRVSLAALALKLLSSQMDTVVSVSKASRSAVRHLLGEKKRTLVIPNITPAQDHPKSQRTDRTDNLHALVAVGTLNRRKNWSIAIRALSLLDSRYTLTIYGDGPMRA